ncbi:MAG: hypothetical protein QM485_01855 [Flavobacteriaceae bacterium]
MRLQYKNGLKPFVLKSTALFLAIAYTLGPVHYKIRDILHTISHSLEAPPLILSHNVEHYAKHSVNTDLENELDHHNTGEAHSHHLLNTLSLFLGRTDAQEHQRTTLEVEFKVDKHIVSNRFKLQQITNNKILTVLWVRLKVSLKGYSSKPYKPPKKSIV